jgi:tellurite resistance protein
MTSSPAEVEQSTTEALRDGLAALNAKSPEDVAAYQAVVLDVAESVAAAAKGVSATENAALEKIRTALGVSN